MQRVRKWNLCHLLPEPALAWRSCLLQVAPASAGEGHGVGRAEGAGLGARLLSRQTAAREDGSTYKSGKQAKIKGDLRRKAGLGQVRRLAGPVAVFA